MPVFSSSTAALIFFYFFFFVLFDSFALTQRGIAWRGMAWPVVCLPLPDSKKAAAKTLLEVRHTAKKHTH